MEFCHWLSSDRRIPDSSMDVSSEERSSADPDAVLSVGEMTKKKILPRQTSHLRLLQSHQSLVRRNDVLYCWTIRKYEWWCYWRNWCTYIYNICWLLAEASQIQPHHHQVYLSSVCGWRMKERWKSPEAECPGSTQCCWERFSAQAFWGQGTNREREILEKEKLDSLYIIK